MKILFNYDPSPALQRQLAQLSEYDVEIVCCSEADDTELFRELPTADVLWHVLRPVDRELLDHAPQLKLVQKIGVGVNTIDQALTQARGIAVCNMPGTNSRAVAEMTLMMMLGALRHLPKMERTIRSGAWYTDKQTQDQQTEIFGKRVGFLGFGGVPQLLAPMVAAMGAEVIYTARAQKSFPYPFAAMEEVIRTADILSLHLTLTEETANIINSETIATMKPGAILINTARGGLVDERALYQALQSKQIAAAALDVFAQEPIATDHPFFELDNVIMTPHTAWISRETWDRSLAVAIENVLALRDGGEFRHRVW